MARRKHTAEQTINKLREEPAQASRELLAAFRAAQGGG